MDQKSVFALPSGEKRKYNSTLLNRDNSTFEVAVVVNGNCARFSKVYIKSGRRYYTIAMSAKENQARHTVKTNRLDNLDFAIKISSQSCRFEVFKIEVKFPGAENLLEKYSIDVNYPNRLLLADQLEQGQTAIPLEKQEGTADLN